MMTISPFPPSDYFRDLDALYVYPLTLCAIVSVTIYIISIITGNVSQVDRLWTILPTIYTAYWALLPLWPLENTTWGYLLPYVPERASDHARQFSPRALLMLGLTVRTSPYP